jgi:superfamily II DNA/RNA helicase
VFFHGGVPGRERGALIEQFEQDAQCRVFLATDAGSVGLNLQRTAATVVNMDLPWNPAVLEQRIGRVHRLGQSRQVQVVNFVASDSIEEGILSLLAFKKSLFSGVLDGGDAQVMLEGTKLSRFMNSVDRITQANVVAPSVDVAAEPTRENTGSVPLSQAEVANNALPSGNSTSQGDALAPLLEVGSKLLKSLVIERDATTGVSVLKLTFPEPAVLQQLVGALSALLPKA